MKKRIYLSPPHMGGSELEFVKNAFASNWISPVGPDINAFEQEVCHYLGANYCLALSSGTAAIHLSLYLANIQPGDEVLTSSFTFAGSAFPINYVGATPVFVDSNEESWNMDPELLEYAIKDRLKKGVKPKACIVVHLYGTAADLDPIKAICDRYNIILIEDAAESVGAKYKNTYTGTIAPWGIFSFNGNKIITTSGGGMLVGKDKKQIELARYLSTQAREPFPYYEHSQIGHNYRMSNIIAAIGRGQLEVLNKRIKQKKEIFNFYHQKLSSLKGITFMPQPKFSESNYWLTCIVIKPKISNFTNEDIRLVLERENIESRPLWKPMHLQPVFKDCPCYTNGVSEKLFKSGLCLPSGTAMSSDQMNHIVEIIQKFAFENSPSN